MSKASQPLPSPGIRFGPDFAQRVGALAIRLSAGSNRREGRGRVAFFGAGEEFAGYRPYRPGEDLRSMDWNVYARTRRPYLRTSKRESSEHWTILLDSSASMGIGHPGKLQAAAEVATAVAVLGLRMGARTELIASGNRTRLQLNARTGLGDWMSRLELLQAEGSEGLASLVGAQARTTIARQAGRVFALGDLFDLEPESLLGSMAPGRELFAVRVLAEEEWAPRAEQGSVEWLDPEHEDSCTLNVNHNLIVAYERELTRELEAWRNACARHRVALVCTTSERSFESVTMELIAGT